MKKTMVFIVVCRIADMDDEFFDSFGKDGLDFWVSMQLLTAILFFAAGIVGYISYEKHDRDQ